MFQGERGKKGGGVMKRGEERQYVEERREAGEERDKRERDGIWETGDGRRERRKTRGKEMGGGRR